MDGSPKEQSLKYLGPPTDSRGVVRKRRLHLGAAASLAELAEYRLFSPAIPYLWGGFREVYWWEWMRDLGHDVELFFHKFEQPVFEGLISQTQSSDWNYALMACRTEDWERVVDFFCELTVTMRTAKSAVRYGLQDLFVLDPLAMDRRKIFVGEQKRAVIHAFGLYGSHGVAYFEQPVPGALPRLTFAEADPEMVEFAKAYFKERNPIHATEALELSQPIAQIPEHIPLEQRSPADQERIRRIINQKR